MSNRPVKTTPALMVAFSGTEAPLSRAVVRGDVIYCSGTG